MKYDRMNFSASVDFLVVFVFEMNQVIIVDLTGALLFSFKSCEAG
jgi:hypothetical protein